jgi:hypothetical protein
MNTGSFRAFDNRDSRREERFEAIFLHPFKNFNVKIPKRIASSLADLERETPTYDLVIVTFAQRVSLCCCRMAFVHDKECRHIDRPKGRIPVKSETNEAVGYCSGRLFFNRLSAEMESGAEDLCGTFPFIAYNGIIHRLLFMRHGFVLDHHLLK